MTGGAALYGDAAARERIRASLAESLIVEASAGTGKTTELVARIVAVLERGLTTIDRIAAVTFTNKAAGELKLRLRQELDRARSRAQDPASRHNLEDALERLEEASAGTIHAFCAQILRERPVEANVDPAFEEMDEVSARRLFERVFRSWFQEKLGAGSPGLRRALTRIAARPGRNEDSPAEQILSAAWALAEWRDFPCAWTRAIFDRRGGIDHLLDEIGAIAGVLLQARANDPLAQSLRPLADFIVWAGRMEEAGGKRDYDMLESRFGRLASELKRVERKGGGPWFAPGVARKDFLARRDALFASMEQFERDAAADLAAFLREDLRDLIERYDDAKRRAGKLDFLDLLLSARRLVRDNAEVRRFLQARFTHLFVDEFQDTDPLQAEILLLLSSSDPEESDWMSVVPAPGKFFAVGDPKQSIYKFRRADVTLYRQIRDALCARGAGLVRLTRSFRSVRPIQECVNAAFAPEMTGDGASGQSEYAPLEEHTDAIPGQPAVIALPPPRPYKTRRIAQTAIDECLPETIAGFVEWLLRSSGWKVHNPRRLSELTPVQPQHVAILFRHFVRYFEDISRPLVRALEGRGIAHMLVSSKSFHRREEVETLRAALAAIEWPDDELSVFAALRGPMFALPDTSLLEFRERIGRLQPFHEYPEMPPEFEEIAEVLALLRDLHRMRNRRPAADTVNLLLEAARAHAGIAFRPGGRQAIANLHRIAGLARAYETGGGISFRGFVEQLEAEAERARSVEAPVIEEGAEGVRLMSVHSAKGLEFPVVILADITTNLSRRTPERYVDPGRGLCALQIAGCAPRELIENQAVELEREKAEGVRVAYVAATRARDLLVVPAVGDGPYEGWLAPLNKALYPAAGAFRNSAPAEGCPSFGDRTVFNRPPEYGTEEVSVAPGSHKPRVGSHSLVWWDPSVLPPPPEGNYGLREETALMGSEEQAAEDLSQYEAWRRQREERIQAAARPSLDVFAATEAGAAPGGFTCPVRIERLPRAASRPSGKRFGALVHQVLRVAPLDAGRDAIQAAVQLHARVLGAPEEEAGAAIDAVEAALAHPLLAAARQAERCHREYPVMLKLDGGRLLEGVIDLAWLSGGTWRVVDFKTDADLAMLPAAYERQLQWYAYALHAGTGRPVEAFLLSV